MWWTILTVVLVVVALAVMLGAGALFRFGGRRGPTIADAVQDRFWMRWGQRRGD
jgi:hypothetical protein